MFSITEFIIFYFIVVVPVSLVITTRCIANAKRRDAELWDLEVEGAMRIANANTQTNK